MKKKNKLRKILPAAVIGLLAVAMVSAGLLTYFGRLQVDTEVSRAIVLTGDSCTDNLCTESSTIFGGESVTTEEYKATSMTSVDIPIEIETTSTPNDGGVESATIKYKLHAEGEAPREQRIRINAEDAGIAKLSDLSTIEFDQNVSEGYVGHVDVRVIKSDGTEDALVFEYAKVDATDCDDTADYPTGEVDTFGDKGIVDNNANAWLSSGDAGPCGGASFIDGSLSEWKAGISGIDGNSKVVAFEFEVDSWIQTSTDVISNIKINGVAQDVITAQAGKDINFNVAFKFANGAEGDYTSTTDIKVIN